MREPFTIEHSPGGGKTFVRGIGVLLLLGIAVILAFSATSCVGTGHVGIVSVFGRVTGRTLPEGIHIVSPISSVTELSIKTQEIKEKASVPSKEGLIMGLEASILYHLDPAQAATVYQQMGPTYADILLIPTFRSAIRAITAGNTAASLYSDGREGIAQQILEDVRRQVAPRGVIVENVLLRDLQLPETLKHAIEAKQQAQQEAQRMEYVLQREKQEAERKRVEAAGIKDFQDIVSQGISEKLLEWKGIEATMELVKSTNAKVIVVGNAKNGLPLIYSGDK
ncbi:MAG TPA: prohibitin family protein [Vicinamibacterales bacterium]|jgi:prohibitin 1|nr:prohibitin family protein [Vicinamibacterales bacterium]